MRGFSWRRWVGYDELHCLIFLFPWFTAVGLGIFLLYLSSGLGRLEFYWFSSLFCAIPFTYIATYFSQYLDMFVFFLAGYI